jgi:ParB family chromosome partitioning protein
MQRSFSCFFALDIVYDCRIETLYKGVSACCCQRKLGLYDTGRITYIPVTEIAPNPDRPRGAATRRDTGPVGQHYALRRPPAADGAERPGGYELISGERRLRAAKLAELREVPCIVL